MMGCSCLFLSPTSPSSSGTTCSKSELRTVDSVGWAPRPQSQCLSSIRSSCRWLQFQEQEASESVWAHKWRQRFFWMLSWLSSFPNCKSNFCGFFHTSSERTLFSRTAFREPWAASLLGPAPLTRALRESESQQTRSHLAPGKLFILL